jgi:hypothetical protein
MVSRGWCLVFLVVAACVGEPPAAVAFPPSRGVALLEHLRSYRTTNEVRAYLMSGIPKSDLDHMTFDLVTVRECIDHVVAAVVEHGARRDELWSAQAVEWAERYYDAKLDAAYRGLPGASCIPYGR